MILATKFARTIVHLEDTEDIATQHMNHRKYEVAFEPMSPFSG